MKPELEDVTAQQKIALALRLDSIVTAADARITPQYANVASGSETFALRNSLGLDLSHSSNMIYAYTSVVAKEGERTATGMQLLWGYGLEGKSTEKFINKYCNVKELTVFQGKREEIDEDAYDYIIKSPGIVAENLSDKFTSMTELFLTEFSGQVYVLTKEEGGRHTAFMKGYRPQFDIRTTDVTGDIQLPEGVEMVMPGDNVEIAVKLIAPVALEEKMRFAIREGGRTVGAGTVSKVIK
jgi:hypothetical protein